MKTTAVRLYGANDLRLEEFELPEIKETEVLMRVVTDSLCTSTYKAVKQGAAHKRVPPDIAEKPIIVGHEMCGEIVKVGAQLTDKWKVGQKVVAPMGGMGRSFNGSYAEYALLPVHHVFPVDTDLPWDALAAVPETWFTAWGSLFECLHLKSEDTLLIRGATCALGYSTIQIARALGCRVIATTHREAKLPLLSEADEAVLDDGRLTGRIHGVTKALDLVGPRFLKDTLTAVEKGGIVCNTGILGGVFTLNGFDPIKDIPNGVYLTGFFSNYPAQNAIDAIFEFISAHRIVPDYGAKYRFEDIREACIALDSGKINGKIIVVKEG